MEFRITGIREVTKGNLRAFADVRFAGLVTVKDFRIVRAEGQRPWVSLPVRQWQGPGGEKFYTPLIDISNGLKQQICEAILSEWLRFSNDGERDKEHGANTEAGTRT